MDGCTTQCREVLLSLLTSGGQANDMMHCTCDGDAYCIRQRLAVEPCRDQVLSAINSVKDPQSILKCSLAKLICEADTSCLTALRYYSDLCVDMFKGNRCSKECNNSLTVLHQQKQAQKLTTCTCDKQTNYENDCETVRRNTMRLCLNNNASSYTKHQWFNTSNQAIVINARLAAFLALIVSIIHLCNQFK
ncbi:growth arrest-specific protein 1-like [Tubulanus polymorphus]|uniref:growth arrest-specific protein 1-like n=1 Tax=Tubulanus polymorphus TaxID=672921 RepID=UPI003DA294BF